MYENVGNFMDIIFISLPLIYKSLLISNKHDQKSISMIMINIRMKMVSRYILKLYKALKGRKMHNLYD